MTGKLIGADDMAGHLADGMTIGIGGWGSRRKPMSLVRAVVRSRVRDLTIVSFGGPDVGILCATGQASKVVFGFVSLDTIPIEPHFARARELGGIDIMEFDEAMLVAGLRAAGRRLPFEATRAGLGSDAVRLNPDIRTITSPYADGEELVAMPAIHVDVALVHLNKADERGNCELLGPEPYFDDLFAMAAERTFVSVEEIVSTEALARGSKAGTVLLNRSMVDGVIAAGNGAHFTSCPPHYGRDEAFQRAYADSAASVEAWELFRARFLDGTESDYQGAIAAFADESLGQRP